MSGHALKLLENVTRRDLFYVPIKDIVIIEGLNPRSSPGDLESLIQTIADNIEPKTGNVLGIDPLRCLKLPGGSIGLIGGHRRYSAAKIVSKDINALKLPVMLCDEKLDPGNPEDFIRLYTLAIAHNSSVPFTPAEEAVAFKKLADHGMMVDAIAAQTGRSVSCVRNRLKLAEVGAETLADIEANKITLSDAMAGKVADGQDEQVDPYKQYDPAPAPDPVQTDKFVPKPKARPYNKKRLIFSYTDNGMIKTTGIKSLTCDPIEAIMEKDSWRKEIQDAGFDPDTIKISIEPIPEK